MQQEWLGGRTGGLIVHGERHSEPWGFARVGGEVKRLRRVCAVLHHSHEFGVVAEERELSLLLLEERDGRVLVLEFLVGYLLGVFLRQAGVRVPITANEGKEAGVNFTGTHEHTEETLTWAKECKSQTRSPQTQRSHRSRSP